LTIYAIAFTPGLRGLVYVGTHGGASYRLMMAAPPAS
jgi:hypothetical protein